MRRLLTALAFVASFTGHAATAQTVVELYTSQGCSSCPPADALLSDLANRPDVIALALHVDYWDYLGWKDDLAHPAFTRRQRGYAQAAGTATIYTPQMIFGGVDHVVGSRPMRVMDQLLAHGKTANPVQVTLTRSGSTLRINAEATRSLRATTVVQIVRYTPLITREIRRGENAGKTIRYVNTVTSWQAAGNWDTGQSLTMEAAVPGDDGVVVIVQDGTNGPILGAAKLR